MAEGGRSDNPFSFKAFVKSKQETKDVKIKKKQDKQHNSRKGEICPDESPFPEVTANKPVHSQQGKLQPLIIFGHFCISGAFSNSHRFNPFPHLMNNVGRMYPDFFFRVSTLYSVGEGELQENFVKDALFCGRTEK